MIINVQIDNKEFEVSDGISILAACSDLDIFVPYLCYLKDSLPNGACGLCVVEINEEQISLACKTRVQDGMRIKTNSHKLSDIRKTNLKKILEEHEINCLNCSKNGTCRLQIISARIFGYDQHFDFQPIKQKKIIQKLSDDLIYTNSKCISCMRCVRFLNSRNSQKIKNISQFRDIENISNLSQNIIDICPTAAISSVSSNMLPVFLCNTKKTFDVSDAFFSRLEVKTYDNQIISVQKSHDSLISDETRIDAQNLPKRIFDQKLYQSAVDKVCDAINSIKASTRHEKVIFVIGKIIDIETAGILDYLSQKFPNILIATSDNSLINSKHNVGLDRSDLLFMENATLLGEFNDSEIYKITQVASRLKSYTISKDLQNLDTSNYILISARSYEKYKDLEMLNNFENVRIIPSKTSQMLFKNFQNLQSLDGILNDYNKRDIILMCAIGDVDCDLSNLDISTVYHAVCKTHDSWIPSKHFLEQGASYKNIFGEIVKTDAVVSSNLKSHYELLRDILQKLFVSETENIFENVDIYIKERFSN